MVSGKPGILEALLIAGKQLSADSSSRAIATTDLKRLAAEISGYLESSIIPSDFCYDSVNESAVSFVDPIFVRPERGYYYFLGLNFQYTGPVHWKSKSGEARQVGFWKDGVCTLDFDPRIKK